MFFVVLYSPFDKTGLQFCKKSAIGSNHSRPWIQQCDTKHDFVPQVNVPILEGTMVSALYDDLEEVFYSQS